MNDQLTDDFILQLFHSCVVNKNIFDLTVEHVKENWLPQEKQKKYLQELNKLKEKGAKRIMFSVFELEFRKVKKLKEYAREIQDYDEEYDESLMVQKLEEFIKNSKFIELYDETYEVYNRGEKPKAYQMLINKAEDLSNFSLVSANDMTPVFGGFHKRQTKRMIDRSKATNEKVPFGMDELDRVTHGGAERGEFVLFVADAKAGKSICLIHCAINAARRGVGVAHFQCEGTRKQVDDRYDSAWSGSTYYDIKDANIDDKKYEDHKKIVAQLGTTDIWVDCAESFNARTMDDIRNKVIELKRTHDIGVVIIDYLDLVNPDSGKYSTNDERHRQQKTSRRMKDLASEQDVIVISATQASSISKELLDDPDFVITREHLAEDKGKVRPVDMLISINRTPDERKARIARLYCDALREHDSGQVIKIAQNLSRTRFYDRKRTLELHDEDN